MTHCWGQSRKSVGGSGGSPPIALILSISAYTYRRRDHSRTSKSFMRSACPCTVVSIDANRSRVSRRSSLRSSMYSSRDERSSVSLLLLRVNKCPRYRPPTVRRPMIAVGPIHSIMSLPLVVSYLLRINKPDDREDGGGKTEVRETSNPVAVIGAVGDYFPDPLDQIGAAP